MKLIIETLSHSPLNLLPTLPAQFPGPRISGGEVLSASGEFGNLYLQEVNGGNFIIRHSIIDTKEEFLVTAQSNHSGVHAVIMLRNHANPIIKNATNVDLREGQFTMMQADQPAATVHFKQKQQYAFFEIMLSEKLADSVLKDFPDVAINLMTPAPEKPDIWVNPAKWTDQEVREHVHYILHYSDRPEWRRNYFENRVYDIAWKLLAIHVRAGSSEPIMTEEEKEKATRVHDLIVDNLDVHMLTRELARNVGTSESRLKKIFMKAYGMGMHEYRIYERLRKAIQLLNEGMTVKEAAAQTGWRSADLIKAYYKVYKTTPGTLKKKK